MRAGGTTTTLLGERYPRYVAGQLSYLCTVGEPWSHRKCNGQRRHLTESALIPCQCECHSATPAAA